MPDTADESGLSVSREWRRWYRPAMLGLAVALLLLAVVSTVAAYGVVTTDPRVRFGVDLDIMRELGRRWLTTGTMYLPYQLAGPYSIDATPDALASTPALYPPPVGPVFGIVHLVPFGLMAVLWWTIPLAVIARSILSWRPRPWAWPLMAATLVHPMAAAQLMVGGTSLWIVAFTAAGLRYRWPAALILLKPTMAPFALVGIRDWRWWLVVVGIAAITLLGPWADYIKVAQNASESGHGLLYSLAAYPMTLLPVAAWIGRSRPEAGDTT